MAEEEKTTTTPKTETVKEKSFVEAIKAKDFDSIKDIASKAAKEHFEESTKNLSEDMKNLKAHPWTKKLMKKVEEIKNK